jgi:hypothetical protein
MPLPAAIPLAELLASGVGALGVGKGVKEVLKNIPQGDNTQLEDTFKRLFLGPSVLPRTIDTPSGKVFAPDDPIPAKPNILATYPQSKDQPWIMSSPMPAGEPKGLMGLPIPETQDKLKGFEKPQDVDTSVLMQNKIPTWEKYFNNKEEFEKTAKENNIPIEDLERAAIKKQITFKKTYYGARIYFDGKFVGELDNITKTTGGEVARGKYGNAYSVRLVNSGLTTEEVNVFDGLNYSKDMSKNIIANSLLDKDYNDSLRNIFFNIKYDKKGQPIEYIPDEKIEKEYLDKYINAIENKDYKTFDEVRNYDFEDSPLRSQTFKDTLVKYIPKVADFHKQEYLDNQKAVEETLNRTGNPVGSLIDKPLSDETN